jgi:sugar phosphate isomerase/epimerase
VDDTAGLQIGINARLFPDNWRPACQEITFAARHGFQAIQFRGPEEGLAAEHLGDSLETVADALAQTRLTVVLEMVIRVDLDALESGGRAPLDALHANVPAITALPCHYVHWHLVPSGPMSVSDVRQLERQLTAQFEAALTVAEAQGFVFGFEHNEPELQLFSRPEDCAALLECLPTLGFVWDVNHTRPEHLARFRRLIPRASALHVSDTPFPMLNHHLPLGQGHLDLAAFSRALLEGGFRGPAVLEIGGQPKSGGTGKDTDAALIDSKRRLREAITKANATPRAQPAV